MKANIAALKNSTQENGGIPKKQDEESKVKITASEEQKREDKDQASDESGSGGSESSSESHLITITERTFEESRTGLNSSQVSVSQMLMDDLKLILSNQNHK